LERIVGSTAVTSPEISAGWVAGTWTSFFDNISSSLGEMLRVSCWVPSKTATRADGEFSLSVATIPEGYGAEREGECSNTEREIESELDWK
jgi:hypothetical protein